MLADELKRFADAVKAGDKSVALGLSGLSQEESEAVTHFNEAYATIASYVTDAKKMTEALEHRDELLMAVNHAAVTLLNSDVDFFEDALEMSVSIIAEALDVDCVYFWKNHSENGELFCSQIFEWSPSKTKFADGTSYSYEEVVPGWQQTLSNGYYINSLVRELSEKEQAHLSSEGILSILVVPIFINDKFWGFVGYDDCHSERVFSREDVSILHSASLIIANSFIRNEMILSIRQTTSQLEEALVQANAASKAKGDFLAKMSHEIRTPMNAIIGMTELALRDEMPTSVRDHIFTAKQASVNLLAIINDLLDFSKIESGDMRIAPIEYSLSSLINDVVSIIRMRVVDTQLRFAVNLDSNLPNSLLGDVTRIRQVLINILGNAVKYTDSGFVHLKVSGDMIDRNAVTLKLEVEDSGRGIKEEDFANLFEKYFQVETGTADGMEGVGLGLAITWNIVKAMGGDITVESEYGKGSTFTVKLPQVVRSNDKLAVVARSSEITTLVYECREIYLESIIYAINNLGVRCESTSDKDEFIRNIEQNSYSYVFLSHGLFEQNRGKILENSKRFKIVLLTEFGQDTPTGDWNILSMPVNAISVANLFNGAQDSFTYSTSSEMYARFTAPDVRVLVVDDIKTNLVVASGLLSPYRMQIDLCDGGAEAVETVKSNKYDIVFMDHRMPDVDGVEAVKRIRKMGIDDPSFSELPIIALTANAVSGVREMFMENGFDDFMPKPIDTVKLNSILEQWIPKHKQKILTDDNLSAANAYIDTLNIDGLNYAMGVRLSGGEEKAYHNTLGVFYDDGLERIEKIANCLESGDLDLYTTLVHALKSALANIGADELSESAFELEMAGQLDDLPFIEEKKQCVPFCPEAPHRRYWQRFVPSQRCK